MVFFETEHATVYVDGIDVTASYAAYSETGIDFTVIADDGYKVESVSAPDGFLTTVDEIAGLYHIDGLYESTTVNISTVDTDIISELPLITFTAVDENGEVINEEYRNVTVEGFGGAWNFETTPLETDVTRVVNVEGTNRQYLETYEYQKEAMIGNERIISINYPASIDDTAVTETEETGTACSCVLENGTEIEIAEDTEIKLVYSPEYKKARYVYDEDPAIYVEAIVDDPAAVPDDAEFVVTRVLPMDANYSAYMDALNSHEEELAAQKDETLFATHDEKNTLKINGPEGFNTVTLKLGDFEKQKNGTYVYELKKIPLGEYTVEETQANIAGYDVKTSMSVEDGKVEVKNGETAEVAITNEYTRKTGKLTFTKSVSGGVTKEEAEGALTFTIQNTTTGKYLTVAADGNAEWKKTEKAPELTLGQLSKLKKGYKVTGDAKKGFLFTVVLDNVELGKYEITEQNYEIKGYKFNKSTSVTSGTAELTAGKNQAAIDLKDAYTKTYSMTIIRRNEVTGAPIIGAKIQVLDSDGNVVDEWVTDGKPHIVPDLVPGTYTIHEVSTPAGVEKAPDMTVKVTENGQITDESGKKVYKDGEVPIETGISFKISKVDENGTRLEGAEFVLMDSTGKEQIDKWTSDKGTWDISTKLNEGKSYILVETKAPNGYQICNQQYKISVAKDGTVKVKYGENNANIKNNVLEVENKKISAQTSTGSTAGTSGTSGGYYSGYSTSYGTTATGGVRTGDDTNTMLFVYEGLAGIAMFAIAAAVLRRRRRSRK